MVNKGNQGFSLYRIPRKLADGSIMRYWAIRQAYWDKERGGARTRYVCYLGVKKQITRKSLRRAQKDHSDLTVAILKRLGVRITADD